MIRKISLDASNLLIDGKYTSGDIVLVVCDATLNNISIQLPDATALKDVLLFIKKVDSTANTVTFTGLAGQTIDGVTSIELSTQYEADILITDGLNYYRFA